MPIEIAVLLAVPVVGALWSGALGITAVVNDLRNRRHAATRPDAVPEPQPVGRHRLVQTGRHHLRPMPAHAG